MLGINRRSIKIIIRVFVIVGMILCTGLAVYRLFADKEEAPHQWTENNIYGKWKNVRLVESSEHSYGWLPLGNEIGRTLTITETQVIDSKDIRQAEEEQQTTYDMEIASLEMTVPEDWVEIQLGYMIIMDYAGVSGERI